jgi:hypothetical protein
MKRVMSQSKAGRKRRRGLLSLELLITLPIFLVLLLGLLEYSLLFAARGDVAEACRAGVRRAALIDATLDDVENAVRSTLGPRMGRLAEINTDLGEHTGDVVAVAVRVPMNVASPDLLWPIGFGLRDRYFVCQSRMAKE